jgi:hypothetical protein
MVSFKERLPKENNRLTGENSPNLVALSTTNPTLWTSEEF